VLHIIAMKDEKIFLAHGAGGKQTRVLIESLILKYFNDSLLKSLPDAAVVSIPSDSERICFTTDSFVVKPLFFPGGDIGKLAICGTINDLAVSGAKPAYISCSLIIEEGFSIQYLEKILKSMAKAARKSCVRVVTGDTKVVEKGKCDGIFITTSGIGIKRYQVPSGLQDIKPGDAIILSGVPGMHELAVVCSRENLNFDMTLKSDCAAIDGLIDGVLRVSNRIRFMRDPTRGGLAACLNEIASGCNFGLKIYEDKIPMTEQVRSICEILGFDVINLACEGRVVMIVDCEDAERIVSVMRKHPLGTRAEIIGRVSCECSGRVILQTIHGFERFIRMPSGKQLPRIC